MLWKHSMSFCLMPLQQPDLHKKLLHMMQLSIKLVLHLNLTSLTRVVGQLQGIQFDSEIGGPAHWWEDAQLSNYSSMDGILYCKTHFEQLFRESGNFSKNFQSPAKNTDKLMPELTRSPSKAAGMFSGTQEKCAICSKTAYPLEKVTVEGLAYHKSCFKCTHGGCPISPSNYAALEGILYCKHHFSQLFKEKGSYNHLIKCASVKRTPAPVRDS